MSLLLNICKYEQCGRIFPSLSKLIEHIESTHVNFNPEVVELLEKEKPTALPLSYVLPSGLVKPEQLYTSSRSVVCAETADEAESEPENDEESIDIEIGDNDSSSSRHGLDSDEDLIAEFIMHYGSKPIGNKLEEKPYACPVPGCMKRYKNANGIKYHSKHGHCKNKKPYECYCGKRYTTNQGLKNHMALRHNMAMSNDVVITATDISSLMPTVIMNSTPPSALPATPTEFSSSTLSTSGSMNSTSSPIPMAASTSIETLNMTTLETLPSSFDELCHIDQALNKNTDLVKYTCAVDTVEVNSEPAPMHRNAETTLDILEPTLWPDVDVDDDIQLPFDEAAVFAETFASIDMFDIDDIDFNEEFN